MSWSYQEGWRWCHKCEGLFFAGHPSQGRCPAGGSHDASQSGHYAIPLEDGVQRQNSCVGVTSARGSFLPGIRARGCALRANLMTQAKVARTKWSFTRK